MRIPIAFGLALTLAAGIGCDQKPSPAPLPKLDGDKTPAKTTAPEKAAATLSSGPRVPVDPATTGTIRGKVAFQGKPPKVRIEEMTADPYCEKCNPQGAAAETVIVNENGTLRNVFVYVKRGLENRTFDPPTAPVVLDQKNCRYEPHVFGIRVGQTLRIRNSDATAHNIHALPKLNSEFNFSQPSQGLEGDRTFSIPEVMIHFKCDQHGWMSCYAGVLTHPAFAVTAADGSFELPSLPPGEYEIEAWHEKYGTQTRTVTLGEKESKDVAFTYPGK